MRQYKPRRSWWDDATSEYWKFLIKEFAMQFRAEELNKTNSEHIRILREAATLGIGIPKKKARQYEEEGETPAKEVTEHWLQGRTEEGDTLALFNTPPSPTSETQYSPEAGEGHGRLGKIRFGIPLCSA